MSKLEETLNRIKTHKGVKGIVIMDKEGFPIRSTMSSEETIEYTGLVTQLLEYMEREMAQCEIREPIQFVRMRSKKHEIMIAPDQQFVLIVIQNPGFEELAANAV